jgi:glycosyltransferase involved in cell wall biosynthesis
MTVSVGHYAWICCQLGAREHYAVPLAIYQSAALDNLITDIWVCPNSLLAVSNRNLRERFHPGLAQATVHSFNYQSLAFEARSRLQSRINWDLIIKRNDWFQRRVISKLARCAKRGGNEKTTLFSYSYTARALFEFARAQGWRTVLGQIDPGPRGEHIRIRLLEENPAPPGKWQPAPSDYWDSWRSECELADHIVVNSKWSHDALVEEGVLSDKIRIVPLGYESGKKVAGFRREYPTAFSYERPMRVLFLGQVNLLKGIGPVLEAAKLLRSEPVEFWFVGPVQIHLPAETKREPQLRWFGAVSRGETAWYYQQADVFVFPTFSDGFGLTQLEAQTWRLPVIASKHCGDVVREGENGILLSEISGQVIADVLLDVLHHPNKLFGMASRSGIDEKYSLHSLASSLLGL